ncbi:MAG: PEP-CTERM sorting domain-containing protein, partial [Myxococcota bacterium]
FNGGPGPEPSGMGDLFALAVTTDIILDSTLLQGGTAGSAIISVLSQDFAVVPEPGAALLGLLGLGGLIVVRRLRS